jgi:L-rhamnose mutarotase
MRHCLAIDLHDNPDLIAQYEAHHRDVWPEVLEHLRAHGVRELEIFRLGTRLVMVMDTDDAVFDGEAMARAERGSPRLHEWETLMWHFQKATPWTPAGQKWTPMTPIFRLSDADETPGAQSES